MRWIINILVVLGLAAVAVVYLGQQRAEAQALAQEAQVRDALKRLYEQTSYYAARQLSEAMVRDEETPALPYPVAVEPAWFGGDQPGNVVAGEKHPWLDVAPTGDGSIHPPDPVLYHAHQAGVWYNPNNGVFRARTPPGAGDAETLARYNRLNETDLSALPRDANPDRAPLAYRPGGVPATTLAHAGDATPRAQRQAVVKTVEAVVIDTPDFGNDWLGDAPTPATTANVVKQESKPRPTLMGR